MAWHHIPPPLFPFFCPVVGNHKDAARHIDLTPAVAPVEG